MGLLLLQQGIIQPTIDRALSVNFFYLFFSVKIYQAGARPKNRGDPASTSTFFNNGYLNCSSGFRTPPPAICLFI